MSFGPAFSRHPAAVLQDVSGAGEGEKRAEHARAEERMWREREPLLFELTGRLVLAKTHRP